jgi:hypothetical protein
VTRANTPPPDMTAPTVSLTGPANGAVVAGPAVIVTADAADAVGVVGVQFRVNGLNLGSEVTRPPYRISWSTLSTPDGRHALTAVARDAAGNNRTSAPVTVTLANTPAPGTTAPTISLTAPVAGTVVAGPAVMLTADASDAVGVVGVQFKVDGQNLGSEITKPPYRVSWSTLSTPNGPHAITALARDAAGNVRTSAAVTVKLANRVPAIALTTPATDAIVAGSAVILSADVGDAPGVVAVQFKVNGRNLGSEVTAPPYRISWSTLSTPNGQHSISAVVRDTAGNVTTTSPVSVTLRN